jgi:hypothetical protein
MLITPTIEFIGSRRVRVSWTGTDGQVAWLYVNGVLNGTPRYITGTERAVEIDVPDPFLIEVHECEEGEVPEPIAPPLVKRPTLWWSPREGALRYTIYHKPGAGAAEAVLASVTHVDGRTHYEYRPLQDLRDDGDVWNLFRVEAVSLRGIESVREDWPFLIEGLPAEIESVEVTGAAGVFTIALEAA